MAVYSRTFTFTGAFETWRVPNHTAGTLRVTCIGAQGGRFSTPNGRRGSGGSIRAYLNAAPGTTLYMAVGQDGDSGTYVTSFGSEGGYPYGYSGNGVPRGGGATEVRLSTSIADRIMVAGGGGSGAYGSSGGSGRGYDGGLGISDGGSSADSYAWGSHYSNGGTLTAAGPRGRVDGGTDFPTAGVNGVGGNGGHYILGSGGGGGGGYWGGGGGGSAISTGFGGGGGASWCDTGVFSSVDNTGWTHNNGQVTSIIVTWDGDPWYFPDCSRGFTTVGTYTWTVPDGVTAIAVDMAGADGGLSSNPVNNRALGGRTQAEVAVTPGETLTINVGGRGGNATTGAYGTGGFNGGADGGAGTTTNGGGGGGASDIRRGAAGLSDRIVVAGGAGGEGGNNSGPTWGFGGGGGGSTGTGGTNGEFWNSGNFDNSGGGPGTQVSGGSSSTTAGADGTFGAGGKGRDKQGSNNSVGGGGGGGWYGGEGGGSRVLFGGGGGGGGGGSGYSISSSVVYTNGYRSSDGYVAIYYDCPLGGIYVDGAVH